MKNGGSWTVAYSGVYATVHDLRAETFTKGYLVRRIAISGLVALAAVLGGVAVPATAMAGQPTPAVARPAATVRADIAAAAGADSSAMLRPSGLVAIRAARTPAAASASATGVGEPLISCVLTTDCLGVEGASYTGSEGHPSVLARVARWNGSSWKGVGVALPKGARSVELNGVSCKGAKSCLVVGGYYTSTSLNTVTHVLALSYNGTSLRPTPAVPLPKGATDVALFSVSCATTRYCVALGVAEGSSGTFGGSVPPLIIETWNGAKWTLHTAAASIAKAAVLEPSAISCATSAFCVLAGTELLNVTSNSESTKVYVASWNGKKLTTMKPAAADDPEVTDVSCATASNCAVTGADAGEVTSGGTPSLGAFTEIWNGKTWQLAKVTWPKDTALSATLSVSCYAAHACEAVGADSASAAETAPFDAAAVSFDRAAGVVQAVPAPSKGHSTLFADVSCLPWGDCVAVGKTGETTASSGAVMTGVWNGKAWKLDPGF